jgi:transposase-like protein
MEQDKMKIEMSGQESSKYHREIPYEEKFQAVLHVMAKEKKVKQVCVEMDISRETFREWKKIALEGIARAFLKTEKRGRKPKNYVKEENLRESMEKAQEDQKKLEEKIRVLEEEKRKATQELQIARKATNFFEKNSEDDAKKNASSRKILKEIYSEVPKKPYKTEEA